MSTQIVQALTTQQLHEAADELHALAGSLHAYADGNEAAWSDEHTLRGQLLLALVHGQINVIRDLRASAERRDGVVPFHDRRRT